MKLLIFDSSSIINLIMNGVEETLIELKKVFNGKFIMTYSIKREVIDRPLEIKQFELGALKAKALLEGNVFELPESAGIEHNLLAEKTSEVLRSINKVFSAKNEFMHIIDAGEASCLAVSMLAREKGIDSVIVIDERTTRMLGEKPENLRKLFEKKFHTGVRMFKENLPDISQVKFIRSSELVYIAWKKNLINLKDGNVLDALLYATKYKGASISREEIEEIKNLA